MDKFYYLLLLIFVFGVFIGSVFTFFILNRRKSSFIESFLIDFKNSIDDFKQQNQINSSEIKSALENTSKLAKILTTNQNLKGRFGEECLENIIKTCLPNNNVDYFKQYITKNSDNKQIKPDFLINLPNNKSVLIDCKLNLDKYIEYNKNINSDLESIKKKELISDINSTINNLSNKKYETAVNLDTVDFVFMYIPLEPLVSLIYTDSDFVSTIKNAYDKNIIIVGNSGIITSIRLIKDIWANQIQNQNVDNIINLSQQIYDIIALHSKNLSEIKKQVSDFSNKFDKEFNKFISDSKIFELSEKLKDYGIEPLKRKQGKKLQDTEIEKEFLK